jgi:hypothetical protein
MIMSVLPLYVELQLKDGREFCTCSTIHAKQNNRKEIKPRGVFHVPRGDHTADKVQPRDLAFRISSAISYRTQMRFLCHTYCMIWRPGCVDVI